MIKKSSDKVLAIIPARGGSKRIPNKNIRLFYGLPIIAYSIKAAEEAGCFTEVMVSTDDDKIAKIAKQFGAKVPFMRSQENSSDYAILADVCIEVIKKYLEYDKNFDSICCILPTAPFINLKKIINAKVLLDKGGYSGVFTVVEYSYPIQRSLKIENGFVRMRWPENLFARSQDLEKSYHDAGQFYFIKINTLLAEKKLFSEKSAAIILDNFEAQDIDTEADWKLAEIKYETIKRLRKTQGS